MSERKAPRQLDGRVEVDDVYLGGELRGGKAVRGSDHGGETAIHMVSTFATELGVVLGQQKVAAKSNEITAITELLRALQIKGLLVTIDAMGCQRNIARQITDQGDDNRVPRPWVTHAW